MATEAQVPQYYAPLGGWFTVDPNNGSLVPASAPSGFNINNINQAAADLIGNGLDNAKNLPGLSEAGPSDEQLANVQENAAARGQARRNALGIGQGIPGNGAANNNGGGGGGLSNNDLLALGMMGQGWGNALGNMANAGANMWDASQNGLASIFNTGMQQQTLQQLGQAALQNQANQIANNYSLGNNQLSTLSQLGNAGYQNSLDRINALMKGFSPLISGLGSGQTFAGLGTGMANMMGGGSLGSGGPLGSGGLLGFQSSNGVSASLPSAGQYASYNTGIGTNPAMSPQTAQAGLNSLASTDSGAAPMTVNAQTSPAARQTMADMMATRSGAGGRADATNLGRYEQAAAANLGYGQQAQNAQTANNLQQITSGMYGQNLNRQLGYQQANNQLRLGQLGAAGSLMGSAMNGATGLLGSLGSIG